MKKSKRLNDENDKTYYPEEIPDTSTKKFDHLKHEARIHEYKRIEENRSLRQLKQQRILFTKTDKHIHAVDIILEKAKEAISPYSPIEYTDNGKTFSIRYDRFNFEDPNSFYTFLNQLKAKGCFDKWSVNPFKDANNAEIILTKVSINKLRKYRNEIIYPNITNKLIFYISGKIIYYGKKGQKYETYLNPANNPYKLIKYLTKNPYSEFNAEILANELKKPRSGSDSPLPERRIRDTIASIEDQLSLKKADKFIEVKMCRFSLRCIVEINP